MADSDDPLLLQAKKPAPPFWSLTSASGFENHGQRIVVGQRVTQSASDMFLGWMTADDRVHYYIRQLRDMKFSMPLDDIDAEALAATRMSAAGYWLPMLKAATRLLSPATWVKATSSDQALSRFAETCDQTELDYQVLVKAVKSGRVQAVTDM
jgi:hypothetical protein